MPRVTLNEIKVLSRKSLIAYGAGDVQAEAVAKAVTRAEETGNIICGLYYLESYCVQLASGRVKGKVDPIVSSPRAGAILVDAGFGFAQPAFAKGLDVAVKAARENGIASLAIAHSHTCTSLGFFTEQIAAEGLIGIGFTNASAIVAGPNGKTPVLGTNPIAFTIPGDGAPRMHADFSTSAVALGKITMAKAAGECIPLGWAVDENGTPTTDPDAALSGALVSAGGYKGWAFGLLVECLAAGLTGSVNSVDVKGLKLADGPPHNLGQYYILIDPTAQGGNLDATLDRLTDAMQNDPDARIPGANRKVSDQIDVDDALWEKLSKLAG